MHTPTPRESTATTEALGDVQIRESLRLQLRSKGQKGRRPVVVEELGLRGGLIRVDLAVVDDCLQGFEIKSDFDTLRRLPHQSAAYAQVFDHCTLVATPRHLRGARAIIPPWWGIMVARRAGDSIDLVQVRRERRNHRVDARVLAELIWYADALKLLHRRGGTRGLRGKRRDILWDQICERYELDEIRMTVQRLLKQRAGRRAAPPRS